MARAASILDRSFDGGFLPITAEEVFGAAFPERPEGRDLGTENERDLKGIFEFRICKKQNFTEMS